MVVYRLEQRWEILRRNFENHCNVAECVRKLRTDFGRIEAQSVLYVRYFDKTKPESQKQCLNRHQHQFTVVLNN